MLYTGSFKSNLIIHKDDPTKNKVKTEVKKTRIYVNENWGCYFVRYNNAIWYASPCNSLGSLWELASFYKDFKPGCIQKVKTE